MITAIDETGDFAQNSEELNFFVAVHIDQNNGSYDVKRSQFDVWEKGISDDRKEKGEIKGRNLTEEQLTDFFNQVIDAKPTCKYSVVQIKPTENPEKILTKHQCVEIKELERMVKEASQSGKELMAKEYDKLRIWTRGLNYQKMIKLKCLENIVGLSFANAFELSQFTCYRDNDETNLASLSFKIDKDFIRAENTRLMWGEMFRQFWREYTSVHKVKVILEITDITKKYFDLTDDKRIGTRDVFSNKTSFLESSENWEIRVADILGYIIHRFRNKGKCPEIGKAIFKNLNQNNYMHIILNDVKS